MTKEKLILQFTYDNQVKTIIDCTNKECIGLSLEVFFFKPFFLDILSKINHKLTFDQFFKLMKFNKDHTKFYEKKEKNGYIEFRFEILDSNHILFTILDTPREEIKTALVKRRKTYAIFGMSSLIFIALASASLLLAQRSMVKSTSREANNTMEMLAEQINYSISVNIDSWFSQLDVSSNLFDDIDNLTGNEAKVDSILSNIKERISFDNIGILLNSGSLYYDQASYSIINENLASELITNNVPRYFDTIHFQNDNSEKIIFGIPFSNKSSSNDGLGALCGITDIATLSSFMSVDAFNNTTTVSICKNDGFKVASSNENDQISNYLSELESQMSKDSYSTIEKDFSEGNKGTVEFTANNKSCYLYYSSLNISISSNSNDTWHLLIYVPIDSILTNVNILFKKLFIIIATVSLVMITTSITTSLLIVKRRENDRLLKQQQQINEMLENATNIAIDVSNAKTEFLSNVSHDIRTPINGIMGMTLIAMNNINDEEKVMDSLKKIDGASHHLLSLLNDVLDMSRIEKGKTQIINEEVDLTELCDNCFSIVSGQLSTKRLNFLKVFDDFKHPYVLADSLHLRQIFINILGNAVKFTPEDGTVKFIVREIENDDKDKVTYKFIFEDTGCGMSKEYLTKIYEPFSQAENGSRTKYKGTGLGMTITKQLVDLMKGNIDIESELNKGSKFTVTLTFDIDKEFNKEKVIEDEIDLSGTRILVVEDNELNMEIAKEILENENIIVETAINGQIAVDMFKAHETPYYDGILMDVMMPVMDGLSAAKIIRSLNIANSKNIPILAMSANAFSDDVKKTKEAGMNVHLSKPIDYNLLLNQLSKLIAETAKSK